jgi:gamma-glutamylputrescine oxidase
MEYRPGQLSVAHRARLLDDYRRHADVLATRFGYPHLTFMDRHETAARLGSDFYHGGLRDTGTGHIHPLKLLNGLALAALTANARLHENTPATAIASTAGGVTVTTATGTIRADKCLVAVNAYGGDLEPVSAAHIMPIGSYIGATEPLGGDSPVLPGGEAVDDSRFVIRYFRKSSDGRLLFGGREIYGSHSESNIENHIRRQIVEVYPGLARIGITHGWGGYVGITLPRQPFVREVMANVIATGGYSGHGVMLANYIGRLFAAAVAGNREKLRVFEDLRIRPFPGGRRFRAPLLTLALNWYALRDRI